MSGFLLSVITNSFRQQFVILLQKLVRDVDRMSECFPFFTPLKRLKFTGSI